MKPCDGVVPPDGWVWVDDESPALSLSNGEGIEVWVWPEDGEILILDERDMCSARAPAVAVAAMLRAMGYTVKPPKSGEG